MEVQVLFHMEKWKTTKGRKKNHGNGKFDTKMQMQKAMKKKKTENDKSNEKKNREGQM